MSILIDTGALVAMIDKNDYYHDWAVEQTLVLEPPFYTCESVLTEACFLVMNSGYPASRVLDLAKNGDLVVEFSLSRRANFERVRAVVDKYKDLPASLADACLVCMAETTAVDAKIFTLDTHFSIYRTSKGKPLSLIIPGSFI